MWRLIPDRFMKDWENGYIKVVPTSNSNTRNKYTIQYLSGGIIDKIQSGRLKHTELATIRQFPQLILRIIKQQEAGITSIWDDKNFYTARGNADIKELFNKKVFSYPKPVDLIWYILKKTTPRDSIVLDFFSGSATVAQAVMKQNAFDGGHRKYILIQLPEKCKEGTEAKKSGLQNYLRNRERAHSPCRCKN